MLPRPPLGLLCICLILLATLAWLLTSPPHAEPLPGSVRASASAPDEAVSRATQPVDLAEDRWRQAAVSETLSISTEAAEVTEHHNHGHGEVAKPEASAILPDDFLKRILSPDESSVTIPLPGGGVAAGSVTMIQRDDEGLLLVQGNITRPEVGRFMFQRQTVPGKAGSLAGFIHFDESATAYQVRPLGGDGKPALVKTTVDAVICRAYSPAPEEAEEIPSTHPGDYPIPPDENGVIQLQSLPGATAVVYLDFDGEERTFASWGYVNALPSGATNSQIFEVWKGVSEDYLPFNINITTVRAVYDAAPPGRRMQVIVTPTKDASPGAGGVAYVGSFNWTSPMVCWSFSTTGKYAVEVISHEVGHTLGLKHDGRISPYESYYYGHNDWAPIMGAAYYKNVSQWSKGEYANASNTEDDLSVLTTANNEVAYRVDDHGDDTASATWLDIAGGGAISNDGFIGTTNDSDVFRFTTTGGIAEIHVDGVAYNSNLDLKAEILDSNGSVIASDDISSSLNAHIPGTTLGAGDYFLRVTGVGKGDPGTGYSDYGSLGGYTVTGTITGGIEAERFTLAENPDAGAIVGAISPRVSHGGGALSFAIASGNTAGAFAIHPSTGTISVADPALIDFEALSSQWDDPADFELFVSITDSQGIATEMIRTVITVSDVNEAPVFTSPATLTIPERLQTGTRIATVEATDPDRFDFPTFEIVGGNTDGAFALDAVTGELTVNGTLAYAGTPSFELTLRVTDHFSPVNVVETVMTIHLLSVSNGQTPGKIVRTFFNSIEGVTISNLTQSPNFPNRPHAEEVLESFDSGLSRGDNYGSTVRGYLIAPATGDYTFWISSNDFGELWLSRGADPVDAALVASVPGWSSPGEWTKYPSQQSAIISLTAGEVYYIEARHKEGYGDDHVQVAWRVPGAAAREVIPGKWLVPYLEDYQPWADGVDFTVRESADDGQSLGEVPFVEPDLGQGVSSCSITAGNDAGIFTMSPFGSQIMVADGSALVAGSTHVLTVSAADTGSPAMTGETTVTIRVLGLHERLHTWWRLNETSGPVAADSSGNGRHGSAYGGGSWVSRGPGNQALALNGQDARITCATDSGLSGATPFTVAAWVKVPASHSSTRTLIQQRDDSYYGYVGQYRVRVDYYGRINFNVFGKDADGINQAYQFDITSGDAIDDGTWHHVACVRDGADGRIYIDGVLQASGNGPVRLLDPTLTVAIGYDARDHSGFLDAVVDDVRIYTDALGTQQITRIAGTPVVGITSPVSPSVDVPAGVGLLLEAVASDPDGAAPAMTWSQLSGPGEVVFGSPGAAETTAGFSAAGTYVLRITTSDGVNIATDEITVIAGGSACSPFAGMAYGGAAGGDQETGPDAYFLTSAAAGIPEGAASDAFRLLGQSFAGDFDLRSRVVWAEDLYGTSAERAGIIVRSGTEGAADEISGFIGFDALSQGYWTRRTSVSGENVSASYPSMELPKWCRVTRNGDIVEFFHSNDGVSWIPRGTMTIRGMIRAGLCWASGDPTGFGTAIFDSVSGFSTENIGAIVDAGLDLAAYAEEPVTLAGSVSDDGLPNPPALVSVEWRMVSGPGSAVFGDATQVSTTVTCDHAGDYVFRLVANDGAMKTFDEVRVIVDSIQLGYTPLAPFEDWKQAEFGADADDQPIASPNGDPDADGLPNLLEYALGLDPQHASQPGIEHELTFDTGAARLRLTIQRNPAATDLTYIVETTSDLSDPESWTAVDTLTEIDTPSLLVVRDTLGGPSRFIRLRVDRK